MSTFVAAATSGITNNPDDPEYIVRLVGNFLG